MTTTTMLTVAELQERVRDALTEAITEVHGEEDAYDMIHEVVDSSIPVYTHQIAELVADMPTLLVREPDIGPAQEHWGPAGRYVIANLYEVLTEWAGEIVEELRTSDDLW